MEKITKVIQVKKPLSPKTKDDLLKDMVVAKKEVEELELDLADLKEKEKEKKEQISAQQSTILSLIGQYQVGYTMENVDCEVKYSDGKTQYINIVTGEIEQEFETEDKEQLLLNENIDGTIRDAEDIIREDSQKD